ncbi:MAG: hypothetical protein GXO24_01570, partial [Chlorobi bacterium]|nr:hypothetical protein [Chlorobiota bacterium]
AQTGFNYKILLADGGNPLANHNVIVKIAIKDGYGNIVYAETHNLTTDSNGIATMEIGAGTVDSGNFLQIDWRNSYDMNVVISTDGGQTYTLNETAPFRYVPYAKYAASGGDVHGLNDLYDARTVSGSVYVGHGAGDSTAIQPGICNTSVGLNAMHHNTTGTRNVAVGNSALYHSIDRTDLVAVGDSALFHNGENVQGQWLGNKNTAVGSKSLLANTEGSFNTAVGYKSLTNNTQGSVNVAIGSNSMVNNQTGSDNVAVGGGSLYSNTTGNMNIAIGRAMELNTTGSFNIGMGPSALYSNRSGNSNIALGGSTLSGNRTGNSNIGIGSDALWNNESGNDNIAIGAEALRSARDLSHLVAIGDSALYHNGEGANGGWDGLWNTAVGSKAMYANTVGNANTALGFEALFANTQGSDNTAIGTNALIANTTGSDNTAVGKNCLSSVQSGDNNTAIGVEALVQLTTGSANTVAGTYALYNISTGSFNTVMGYLTLHNTAATQMYGNTAFGYLAGNNTDADSCIYMGLNAGVNNDINHRLYIGNADAQGHSLIEGDMQARELTVNGRFKAEKVLGTDSGQADMRAYAYGLVYYNGSVDTGRSSEGFTVIKTGTGVYEITLSNYQSQNYVVSVTAEIGGAGTPVFAATDYTQSAGTFLVRIYNLSGQTVDNSFHFVVFRP